MFSSPLATMAVAAIFLGIFSKKKLPKNFNKID